MFYISKFFITRHVKLTFLTVKEVTMNQNNIKFKIKATLNGKNTTPLFIRKQFLSLTVTCNL